MATDEIDRGGIIMACRAEEIAYSADSDEIISNLNFEEDVKVINVESECYSMVSLGNCHVFLYSKTYSYVRRKLLRSCWPS